MRYVRPGTICFTWLESLGTGIPRIDGDHRRLLAQLDRMRDALADGRASDCRAVIESFAAELTEHFRNEEKTFSGAEHDWAASHRVQHAVLASRAAIIRRAARGEDDLGVLADYVDALSSVLVTELIGLDTDLRLRHVRNPSALAPRIG